MYLLLIEDDIPLGNVMLRLLKAYYRVDWVRSVAAAVAHISAHDYDLILLDLGLPDGNGVDLLKQIRQKYQTPVLIVSARDTLDDRVQGLDTGADDYIVKPFAPEELLARIRALLRRQAGQATSLICSGDLCFSPAENTFYLQDQPISLPRKEHELLTVLLHAGGKPVSRERLTHQLYSSGNEAESNTIDVYIHALRKILGKKRIETLRGRGFRIVEN